MSLSSHHLLSSPLPRLVVVTEKSHMKKSLGVKQKEKKPKKKRSQEILV